MWLPRYHNCGQSGPIECAVRVRIIIATEVEYKGKLYPTCSTIESPCSTREIADPKHVASRDASAELVVHEPCAETLV